MCFSGWAGWGPLATVCLEVEWEILVGKESWIALYSSGTLLSPLENVIIVRSVIVIP